MLDVQENLEPALLPELAKQPRCQPPHELAGALRRKLIEANHTAPVLLERQVGMATGADKPGGQLAEVRFMADYKHPCAAGAFGQKSEHILG